MSYNNNYKPSEMADAIREIIKIGQETDLCPTSRSLTIKQQAVNAKTLSISETMVPGALKGRWILIGGVKRQVINNSTSGIVLNEAIESAAIGTKIYPGEDGENPNYVETITGTLANPFGDYTSSQLAYMANVENSINMFLVVDGSVLGMGVYPLSMLKPLNSGDNGILFFGASYLPDNAEHYIVADVEYRSGLTRARMMVGGTTVTDVMSYASYITTTLNIIHHPISGGSSVVVGPLSVSANGTYSAPIGEAFNHVTVGIPVYDGSISNV